MKAYVLSVAGAVLLSAVLAIIAPSGRTGKFIKGISKVFVLSVLVSPFFGLLKGNTPSFSGKNAFESDVSYFTACADLLEEEDSKEIQALLQEQFELETEVTTKRSSVDLSLKKITVKLVSFGINEQGGHIDIVSDVQAYLEKRYGCETEVLP